MPRGRRLGLQLDPDASDLGELDRVADEVHEDLPKARGIGHHQPRDVAVPGDRELEALGLDARAHQRLDLAQELRR